MPVAAIFVRPCIGLVVLVALLGSASRATNAQSVEPGDASLEGVVRDSVTGRPLQRAWICVMPPRGMNPFINRCGRTDSTGFYRVESIPASYHGVWASCETLRGLSGKNLASDSMAFDHGARSRRDWLVSSVGCDLRPIRHLAGIFRGHYTPGFESSEFVPCPSDAWFAPGDSLDWYPFDNRRAWAEWKPGAMQHLAWPRVRSVDGYPRYYVRWRGAIVGPGRYGHMGVSSFRIDVDSVFEIRAPSKRDCR